MTPDVENVTPVPTTHTAPLPHTHAPQSDVTLPIVSQTQDIVVEDCDSDDESCAGMPEMIRRDYDSDSSDDDSITSQADDYIAHDVQEHFLPFHDDVHALLSHRYNDGMLELEVEYSTGEICFLPYELVLDDDPLAVAHYILDSSLSKSKAEAKHA